MLACTLYIVRHGQSESNSFDLVGGQTDSPLTELGVHQANESKQLLNAVKFDVVFSSDLQRAAKTAEIISGSPVPDSHKLSALRERDFGSLEGKPLSEWSELSKRYDETYGSLPLDERWQHSYGDGIETNGAMMERFLGALRSIAKQNPGQTILVGTHGGCMRMMLTQLAYAPEEELGPTALANTACVVLECDGVSFNIKNVTGVTLGEK